MWHGTHDGIVDIANAGVIVDQWRDLHGVGDVDGNATINGNADFAAFGNVFGTTLAGSVFDFNNDGTIDGQLTSPGSAPTSA